MLHWNCDSRQTDLFLCVDAATSLTIMNQLAKALYDNTAECPDELAFRKGDILTVINPNVAGTSGWWMCSLYGRHGLAPANRLKLLPQIVTPAVHEMPRLTHGKTDDSVQNIYQTPSIPRTTTSPAYERMDMIYKVPSAHLLASKGPEAPGFMPSTAGAEANKRSSFSTASSPNGKVYDVPNQPKRASLYNKTTPPTPMPRKQVLEKGLNSPETLRCSSPEDSYVYPGPPPPSQDPNYDIPIPSATESRIKMIDGYNTLPSPRKPEWIYDVPVGPEKQSHGISDNLSCKSVSRQMYDTLPAHRKESPPILLYDIPKPKSPDIQITPNVYNKLPSLKPTEESVYVVPAKEELLIQGVTDQPNDQKPLECRGNSSNDFELQRVRLQRMRNFLVCTTFHGIQESGETALREDEQGRNQHLPAADNQRISTASSSSNSSCDSLALSSSSPELLREVTLSQDEACRKLLDLQESVCEAVPKLMDFVSSHWRCKGHLEKHLKEIKEAAELIVCSLTCFLNFALDVKGNARRLTDANLQTRLCKQLSIVEDSGVILQQTVSNLNAAKWPLNKLSQEPGKVQTPDQLERFVMVARTIPDDIKRLVSIINANGKLLFRTPQRDQESVNTTDPPEKKCLDKTKQEGDLAEDDNDYVELQTKEDENKQREVQKEPKENVTPTTETTKAKQHSSDSGGGTEEKELSSMSEHCRLYFGALQKAIGGFVGSLQDDQPPEKFISQSKLVIMVGQRLVDTLYREAHRKGSNQSLLCKSNHLCALLKQLAVATKKAALHFPDRQALHEAQEFATQLAQRAQHFRLSLDL
ncbi:cas scaffolding protein family member 4 isoform X1 [Oreochromis aureus]|uniref:cas scaffolding protein family member 4 isoform X1 n=2 Tax=Oreochromis aureus TaxID=47969 RepID=UPI0012BCACA4|nr:cas scaffolding protein family member 4 isoform X1 [Oreochromis aureus]